MIIIIIINLSGLDDNVTLIIIPKVCPSSFAPLSGSKIKRLLVESINEQKIKQKMFNYV